MVSAQDYSDFLETFKSLDRNSKFWTYFQNQTECGRTSPNLRGLVQINQPKINLNTGRIIELKNISPKNQCREMIDKYKM